MADVPEPRMHGVYGRLALKAMQDALYERELDLAWKELKEVFSRPEILEAEELIMNAIAKHFADQARAIREGRKESQTP
jgi:hypothetical protein